jgi:hypothetical protein
VPREAVSHFEVARHLAPGGVVRMGQVRDRDDLLVGARDPLHDRAAGLPHHRLAARSYSLRTRSASWWSGCLLDHGLWSAVRRLFSSLHRSLGRSRDVRSIPRQASRSGTSQGQSGHLAAREIKTGHRGLRVRASEPWRSRPPPSAVSSLSRFHCTALTGA